MDYEFQLSPYDGASLVPQVSCALEKRTESISREKYPKMWKITDHFNSKKVSEIVLKRRRLRYRVYGILLIIMGAFLLIPGLMLAPGENRHFEPGENSQFQPGRNRQSVPGGCSQPRFGYRF